MNYESNGSLAALRSRDRRSFRTLPHRPVAALDAREEPVGAVPAAVASSLLATVRRRRSPRFVIVDGRGQIFLESIDPDDTDWPRRIFSPDVTTRLVAEVEAQRSHEDLIVLADASTVVRATRLTGGSMPFYAFFIEVVEARDLLKHAGEQFGLSVREVDVLRLIMLGMDSAEIARRLCIAKGTVHAHVKNIGRKTQSTKRTEILAKLLGVR